jgi:hypothetical protein
MGYFITAGGGGGTTTPPAYLFRTGLTLVGTTVDLDPADVQGDPLSEIGGLYEVPNDGQQYARQWIIGGVPTWVPVTSGGVWVGATPPPIVPPATTWVSGALWWRTDPDGDLYIWFPDAAGLGVGAWVRAAKPLADMGIATGVHIGPTPPVSALPGDLWWRNDPDGDMYVLYNDGTNTRWIRTAKPL